MIEMLSFILEVKRIVAHDWVMRLTLLEAVERWKSGGRVCTGTPVLLFPGFPDYKAYGLFVSVKATRWPFEHE